MIRFNKSFRRFAAAALCVILALSAVGCGGGDKKEDSNGNGETGSVSSSLPEVTSKDGVVQSQMISLGEDFATDGMQILAMEDGVFYAFNYSYEGDGLESCEFVQFKEDGSDFKKTAYKPADENTEVSASAFKDGSYYLGLANTANSPALDYMLDNNLSADDEIPEDLSEEAVSTYKISCVSPDGKEKWTKDVREPKDSYSFYIDSMVITDQGIMVVSSEGVDLYSAEDGSFIETICDTTSDDIMGIIHAAPDGTVLMVDDYSTDTKVQIYDKGKKKFVDSIALPTALMGASVFPGREYDLYIASETGIYGAKYGSDQLTAIVNYVNSDLDIEGLQRLIELGEGRLAIQGYGTDVTLNTYILQPVAPEDVKDKKEITLGGYYITYDVRSEVIEFNKSNSDYRIVIQDYSQYDLAEDSYDNPTGLTLMNTDIVSGKIPDILLMNEYMPVNSYISKGLVMDLTERYEADKEINKSDFLQNVVDAFKTDGKMYMLVPGFTVTGVAGKTKYIGDGKDLSIQKAKEIAKGMGLDETGVFGIFDRTSVLSYAIEFSGDQFIDMDTHTCDFNNPQFQELLEFAGQFPQQISDDMNYDYSTQYLADKALLGIQFLNSAYDYYYMTRQLYGDVNVTVTGFPSEENKGPAVAPSLELAISSTASDPDGCWSFIRRFMLDEYQAKLEGFLPISKKTIRAQGEDVIESLKEQELEYQQSLEEQGIEISEEEADAGVDELPSEDEVTEYTDDMDTSAEESEDLTGKPVPEEDFDGTAEEYEQYLKDFEKDEQEDGGEEVVISPEEIVVDEESSTVYGLESLPEFGESDIENMEKLLETLSFSVNSERELLNIIIEEAEAYFEGQKSTAEVSDIIQSRIQVYLKENE